MCGIAGIVGADAAASADVVARMTGRLRHRGPDADGLVAEDEMVFGHRRLAILDLDARANQPLASPSGRSLIVFNGEIYNFAELRADLEAHGERFTTTGDTEVLLRVIERDGPSALERVRGMFALAVWDRQDRSLLLARDRFGEKPLFIAPLGKRLAFASELAALVSVPEVSREIDRDALAIYLEAGYVPAPLTMFAGARSLRPGEWLRWRGGTMSRGSIARWHYTPDPALRSHDAAVEAVREALARAVRRQMVSDMPTGAFLSGGIDSSAVVAMMQRESSRPVTTFTVRFEQTKYDESPIARAVAAHLGTDHHELTVADASFHPDDLWRIVDHVGQPFFDSSAIPTFVVSRYARSLVTVALSGDGGDEMFGGYDIFRDAERIERMAAWPAPSRAAMRLAASAGERLPVVANHARRLRKAAHIVDLPDQATRFAAMQWVFAPDDREALVRPAWRVPMPASGVHSTLAALPEEALGWTTLRRAMYLRTHLNLADDMLVKVDRMAMAASLEVRAPFLDSDLADLAMRLPDEHLFAGRIGKALLRDAVRPFLPAIVFSHPKRGFNLPLHAFANDAFRGMARELLTSPRIERVLDPSALAPVLERGLARVSDAADFSVYQASHQLWTLMQFSAWMERFDI